MSKDIKVMFDEPVSVAGKEVGEVIARKPIMRDIKVASEKHHPNNEPVAWEMALVATLIGITDAECEELEPPVFARISNEVKPFLA